MRALLTGGTGYIGSHTCVQMLAAGHDAVIIDNLYNSHEEVLDRIAQIAGRRPVFYRGDILDGELLARIFSEQKIDAVVHFAGLKAVGESVEKPLFYYQNNVAGTVSLCQAMEAAQVRNLVFSSSCTVYGDPHEVPIREDFPTGATTNPYGRSKYMIEQILTDLQIAVPAWNIRLLRYFNPVGAHVSGLIGEDPNGIPNNLMPYITQVAIGQRSHLNVFGNDYPTPDGTGIRDYIHVVDLADGHVKALEKMPQKPGLEVYNLGTGCGYSVLDVVKAFEKASGKKVPYQIVARRAGDIARTFADPAKANRELAWRADRDIEQMCADSWRWQQYAATMSGNR
ncbi:MAG: UDP-glucose 4-epimerase GalE [Candidatus Riflebacteria bacterium HGW-Riflebacteria-1]|jgi:UDP-glucose 4-epimerase|nr:MAG: UDP-glucose 4-epimerase GalE [Candidatus Riflebacteria bacterium HGW-Riflebacteria-1]